MLRRLLLLICLLLGTSVQSKVLIPMDSSQRDHLKAYGVAYWTLSQGVNVEWLLNYRGGAFLCDGFEGLLRELRVRGVTYSEIGGAETATIYAQIESSNMERILLEKAPKVAIYTPPESQPWDDAVTMALKYAEIEYDTVYDREVLRGDLKDYDWLHLHHEDFTGQYGKFYGSYATAPWYIEQQRTTEALAAELGFKKVSRMRLAVSLTIRDFIEAGGFLFAMCSATDSYDIALAAMNTDICASVFDGDPPAADAQARLDYSQCLAFKDFIVDTNPMIYEYSDIDASPQNGRSIPEEQDWFSLFEFSAKWDPVPTMLTQNHTAVIHGFMGQTTAFRKDRVKDNVIVMGEIEGGNEVRYLHGVAGKGSFTFYGGHDPEDYRHRVGDPETQLTLHRNSPGYRLILNNILFPAAKKQKQKT
ncbi:MAG: asparagine synthetase B [Candidatus Delongbacteria bacterium]|nr:asparagine synthetase B [Candidatus Delongbacteria bacterium]